MTLAAMNLSGGGNLSTELVCLVIDAVKLRATRRSDDGDSGLDDVQKAVSSQD
jgi:hypothetical protein